MIHDKADHYNVQATALNFYNPDAEKCWLLNQRPSRINVTQRSKVKMELSDIQPNPTQLLISLCTVLAHQISELPKKTSRQKLVQSMWPTSHPSNVGPTNALDFVHTSTQQRPD